MRPLDTRKTDPFRFGAEGQRCLLLHGFTGSPWDLRPLADALAERGFCGEVPLLPGHGTTPDAMGRVGAKEWFEASESALLASTRGTQEPLCLAGFSMGALLAILLAARHPDRVRALALLAPAAKLLGVAPKVARALWRLPLPLGPERLLPVQRKGPPDLEDPTVRAASPSPDSFPTRALRELFDLQDQANAAAAHTRAPALLVLAAHDHVVDPGAALQLYVRLPGAGPAVILPRGFHGLARDGSKAQLAQAVGDFFSRHA